MKQTVIDLGGINHAQYGIIRELFRDYINFK